MPQSYITKNALSSVFLPVFVKQVFLPTNFFIMFLVVQFLCVFLIKLKVRRNNSSFSSINSDDFNISKLSGFFHYYSGRNDLYSYLFSYCLGIIDDSFCQTIINPTKTITLPAKQLLF